MPHPVRLILPLCVLTASVGCTPSQAKYKADLRAPDAGSRVPALVDAAERDDPRSLEELVRSLTDEDPAVRLFAIQSLRQRTGMRFGYRYYESEDKRLAAAQRWTDWLASADQPETKEAAADTNP